MLRKTNEGNSIDVVYGHGMDMMLEVTEELQLALAAVRRARELLPSALLGLCPLLEN